LLPQSRPARLILGVLAALLLIAVGSAGGYLYQSSRLPGDNSADAGFARDMSLHHAQAVEMGMYAFQKSQDSEIQILGYDIATTQQYQIGEMNAWLQDWGLSTTPPKGRMSWMTEGTKALQANGLMPGMATADDLTKLKSLSGKDFDILFCQLMLRHHLGGVHMADEALKLVTTQEVKTLAQQIQQGQELEITTLTAKLKTLGAQPL
jgi:uncharacterized protein (DUF305 family)